MRKSLRSAVGPAPLTPPPGWRLAGRTLHGVSALRNRPAPLEVAGQGVERGHGQDVLSEGKDFFMDFIPNRSSG